MEIVLIQKKKELDLTEVDNGIIKIEDLTIDNTEIYYFKVKAEDNYYYSNPIICDKGKRDNIFWRDMHGQTESTVETGTVKEYFQFARDKCLLDFSAWQGNDFQVTSQLWADVKQNFRNFNDTGNFLVFLGYEWSGTTPDGGDHNIYYLGDDEPIYRSSHSQIEDKSDIETDRYPISELWKTFAGRDDVDDVMVTPHVGGRHAYLDYYNPDLINLIKIHCHHGTFEWFAQEALKRGLKVGFIADSDDHTGKSGMSFPTNRGSKYFVYFDVRVGLTAFYADKLTRIEVW